jgi:urate oxidase
VTLGANKHHFVYDISPFGLDNDNEVFNADDRPWGLIQARVIRDDAPRPASPGTHSRAGWVAPLGDARPERRRYSS